MKEEKVLAKAELVVEKNDLMMIKMKKKEKKGRSQNTSTVHEV